MCSAINHKYIASGRLCDWLPPYYADLFKITMALLKSEGFSALDLYICDY